MSSLSLDHDCPQSQVLQASWDSLGFACCLGSKCGCSVDFDVWKRSLFDWNGYYCSSGLMNDSEGISCTAIVTTCSISDIYHLFQSQQLLEFHIQKPIIHCFGQGSRNGSLTGFSLRVCCLQFILLASNFFNLDLF